MEQISCSQFISCSLYMRTRIHLTVLLFGCFITLCFLSYSVFPPFWVGSLRSQTLDSWFCVEQEVQVPKKCTRVWAKRPLFWINLGFPKIVRSRTIFLCTHDAARSRFCGRSCPDMAARCFHGKSLPPMFASKEILVRSHVHQHTTLEIWEFCMNFGKEALCS